MGGYGTVENFVRLCMKGEEGYIEPKSPLNDIKFNSFIDITSGTKNKQARALFGGLFGSSMGAMTFVDGEKLIDSLDSFDERTSAVMRYIFGLYDNKYHSWEETGKKYGLTRERIRQIENKTIRKLRDPSKMKNFRIVSTRLYDTDEYDYTPEEIEKRNALFDRISKSNLIFIPDEEYAQEPDNLLPEEMTEIATELREIRSAAIQRKNQVEGTSLEELELSIRTRNLLIRMGIDTVEKLKNIDREELLKRPLVRPNIIQEIEDKLAEFEQRHVEENEMPEDIITPNIEENTEENAEELSIEQLQEQLETLRKKNKEKEDILLRQQLLREIAKEQQIGLELDAQIREAKDKTK